MNLRSLQAELDKLERRRQILERRIKERASRQFAALPARVGLKSIDELILKLLPYGSSGLRARLGVAALDGRLDGAPRTQGPVRSRGTRYGADVKAAVKRAVEAGGKTVEQISREYGPSVFSIKAWKKKWGLTRARRKK
jgi:hypothetical protein